MAKSEVLDCSGDRCPLRGWVPSELCPPAPGELVGLVDY